MLKSRTFWIVLALVVLLPTAYFWAMLNWSYSSGERAGFVQKLSYKGWICKTWEGELALVSMPGTAPEIFHFTVMDDAVAKRIEQAMGQRVALHYEEKKGLPTSCFGDTRHYVTGLRVAENLPVAPGIAVPKPAPLPMPASAASAP
jgi:4-amino-4-deoxy-L-arabinose transferase-like glycosyltransferase